MVGVGMPGAMASAAVKETRGRALVFAVSAASSTMTEGSLPLVYEAVNSQGWFDTRHSAHGQRPEHLVFFLQSH
jgi:hypothetical protein